MVKELEDTNRLQKTGFQEILEQQFNNLREKETELGELKRTLRMYDESSERDLQTKVDEINAKIQATEGTAMRWTKASSSSPVVAANDGEVGDAGDDNVERVIGGLLFHALRDSKVATPCLMVAWQACIVATVEKILCSFSATLAISEEGQLSDAVLKRISDEVMAGEVQPAYGRWRLITHQYLRQTLSGGEQAAIGAYVSEALANCLAVGRLAMQNRLPNDQSLMDDFQDELRIIMTEAIELSYMIREKMITANYEPYVPSGGASFEPKFMTVEQQEKAAPDDRVICTTGIGLLYWRKEGGEGTSKTSPKLAFKKAQVFTVGNLHVLNSAARAKERKERK
ncbi:hypothetical protein FRC00_000358 [Tulasnella sp. 408]|nr:hypothetical protein FRC00_000358 [Tulasnella sp. 408]